MTDEQYRFPPIPLSLAPPLIPDPRHPSTKPRATRKEILEAEAQDAIDREREARSPHHPDFKFSSVDEAARDLEKKIAQQAVAAMMEQQVQRVRDSINIYFDSLHSTTWGRGFDLMHNREAAVEFLLEAFLGVGTVLGETETRTEKRRRFILVGPNRNVLYNYAKEHGIPYDAATKITRHSEATCLLSQTLDPQWDVVIYVQAFTPSSIQDAIYDLIESRFRR